MCKQCHARDEISMTFTLLDDGTMDTVVQCDECEEEIRYSVDMESVCSCEGDECMADCRIDYVMEDAEATHECERVELLSDA